MKIVIKRNKNELIYSYIDMSNKTNCEYCNKLICKSKLNRHHNSNECRNKQQNKDIIIERIDYKCKYCDKFI